MKFCSKRNTKKIISLFLVLILVAAFVPVFAESNSVPAYFAVAVRDGHATSGGSGDFRTGEEVSIYAGSRSGFVFETWTTSSAGIRFLDATSAETTFTMPANEVIVTARWTAAEVSENSPAAQTPVAADEEIANAIYTWLTWNVIRGHNTNRQQVTFNLTLPTSVPADSRFLDSFGFGARTTSVYTPLDTSGFTIEWLVPGGIATNGTVTVPQSGSGNDVTLTARVRRGNRIFFYQDLSYDNGKPFHLRIVPESQDQRAVSAAIDRIVWNEIRQSNPGVGGGGGGGGGGGTVHTVFANLNLPTSFTYEPDGDDTKSQTVTIRWLSSNERVVKTNGRVLLPCYRYSEEVTLTAVFTSGSITNRESTDNPNVRTFRLRIQRPTNAQAVEAARSALTWDIIRNGNYSEEAITSNLRLPVRRDFDTEVRWSTDNGEAISRNGIVSCATPENGKVTLTATISRGGVSVTRTFELAICERRNGYETE